MKDKEKQIEEMAKEIFNTCAWRFGRPNDYKEIFNDIAEDLTKLNYRKLPKGAKVFIPTDEQYIMLSREEYKRLLDNAIRVDIEYLEQQLAKLRKETAEKILEEGRYCMPIRLKEWIIKQVGVEIKE